MARYLYIEISPEEQQALDAGNETPSTLWEKRTEVAPSKSVNFCKVMAGHGSPTFMIYEVDNLPKATTMRLVLQHEAKYDRPFGDWTAEPLA